MADELRAGPGPKTNYLDSFSDLFRNKLAGPTYFDDASAMVNRLMSKPSASQNLAAWEYNRTPPMPNEGQQNVLGKLLGMVPESVMLASNFIGPGAKPAMPAPKTQGIRAYHGSPHDFDQFSLAHIGKGEGHQAFGHGLYFAENEGVAKSYRDALGTPNRPPEFASADSLVASHKGNVSKALEEALMLRDQHAVSILSDPKYTPPTGEKPGKLYEVNIKADPEHFLDWDKPLIEQPEKIRELGKRLGMSEKADGAGFTAALVNRMGGNERQANPHISKMLQDQGIPGIKYLDQGSRTAGEGSRNYVVFDDKLIEILRKYGLMPPAVAAGAAAMGQGDNQ